MSPWPRRKDRAEREGSRQVNIADRGGVAANRIDALYRTPPSVYEAMGRDSYLERSAKSAVMRTEVRRRGSGLSPEQLARSLAFASPVPAELRRPAFEAGSMRVLTGPLGSGKSDSAEEWFRGLLAETRAGAADSVPVWLDMRAMDQPLESVLTAELGLDLIEATGCDVVVDGLDERTEDAAKMLAQASDFVIRWPRCRVLLTSREMPNALLKSSFDTSVQITMAPMSTAHAKRLINTISGKEVGKLGPQLEEAITRPLFAVLVARHAGALNGATCVPELIDLVVGDIVEAEGFELYRELRTLAVLTVTTGRAVDPASFAAADVVAQLRRSALVATAGVQCSFALATFEQWFAAKALLETEMRVPDILDSLRSFDRWKYVLSIVLAAGEPGRADSIIGEVARWNPGAAAWLVTETQRAGLNRLGSAATVDDWNDIGNRIRSATQAWLDGLGPALAASFAPFSLPGCHSFDDLTVAIAGTVPGRLSVGWMPSRAVPARPRPPVTQISHDLRYGPKILRTRSAPGGVNWVWEWTQQDLADDIGGAFKAIALGVGEWIPGVVRDEKRDHEAMLDARRKAFEDPDNAHSGQVDDPLYPYPDASPAPEHPWGAYGLDQMVQRVKAVLAAALTCYTQLAEAIAPNFGITLAHRGLMPVELFGDLHYSPTTIITPFDYGEPGIRYLLKPMPASLTGELVPNRINLTVNDDGRAGEILQNKDALYAEFRAFVQSRPEYAPFAGPFTITTGSLDVLATRPATRLALQWLWADLKNLNWVSGTAPRLD